MLSAQTIQALRELKPPSGKCLPDSVITGMTKSLDQARYQLIVLQGNPKGAGLQSIPRNGSASLPHNAYSARKLMTVDSRTGYAGMLNKALAGGEGFPILNAILGTAVGFVSAGSGLLFALGTTALDATNTAQGVQVRSGDELWQVEAIGKVRKGAGWDVVHVGSYFLVDPFRSQTVGNGWLIHEERTTLSV